MPYRRFHMPSKPTIFAMLMLASAVLLVVPADVLGPARNMTQLIALPQWALQRATHKATEPIKALTREPLTAEQQGQMLHDKQGLENENVALRQQIEALKRAVEELALLRRQGFPEAGVLIPAPVVALDAAPRRDSLLLGKGQLKGIRREDWVASRLFVQVGEQDGVRRQLAVLARESLIGWVEQTTPLTSRVVLLSDAYASRPMRVYLAHFDAAARRHLQVTAEGRVAPFALHGIGGGKMIVADIDRTFIDAGVIAVGDLVTSDPHDPKLPLAMVVGEIIELRQNEDKPLFYDAVVRHRYDPKALSRVLIVDLSRDPRVDP